MGLGPLKYAWKATKSYGSYLNKRKRGRKTGKAPLRKRLRSLVLIVLSVPGLLILVLSAAGLQSATTAGSGLFGGIPALQRYSAIVDQGNHLSALQDSAESMLTAYPDDRSSGLSSATIDEKTGNQSYMRDAGNGGVSVATDDITGCPTGSDDVNKKMSQYASSLKDTATCGNVKGDLLTGDGGWAYNIPLNMTTENTAIQSFVQILQTLAGALLVLVITMIGIRIVMGGAGGWNFGVLLETLPRLILSLVAVAFCLTLAEELIVCANALNSTFQSAIDGAGISVKPTDIIMPLGNWGEYLHILTYCGAALLVSMAIAPLSVFGFDFGGYIAAGLVGSAVGLMITRASSFVVMGFSMALTALIIVRILLINVYIILSPLAVIAAGLPGQTGQSFTRQWIMGFLSLLASHVAQVVTLGVGMVMLSAYDANLKPTQGDLGELFIKYGTLILMLRVPTLFSSNSTAIIKEVGPALGGALMHDQAPLMPGGGS